MSLFLWTTCRSPQPPSLTVAAAASLYPLLERLRGDIESRWYLRLRVYYGASRILTSQIEAGADYDLFLPAAARFLDELEQAGRLVASTRCRFARGRVTVWWRPDRPLSVTDLRALRHRTWRHIVLANPRYAPYGRAARQALERAGLWTELYPRLVFTDNVRQAFLLVQRGHADVGLVALALARAAGHDGWLVPANLHDPIWHEGAVLRNARAPQRARRVLSFLCSDAIASVLTATGYEPVPTGRREPRPEGEPSPTGQMDSTPGQRSDPNRVGHEGHQENQRRHHSPAAP